MSEEWKLCGSNLDLLVHHIDYEKKNNSEYNLITLCRKCHGKTNWNTLVWRRLFKLGVIG